MEAAVCVVAAFDELPEARRRQWGPFWKDLHEESALLPQLLPFALQLQV